MDELEQALRTTLEDLNRSIERVKRDHPEDPWRAQYPDGRYVLLDANVAKANVLTALARLRRNK